jgi:hypothetical protein
MFPFSLSSLGVLGDLAVPFLCVSKEDRYLTVAAQL